MLDILEHASLVECVPNFSEGRNPAVVQAIVDAIAGVEQVYVLHVDVGYDANRTVVTFVGPPQQVAEAAFRGISTAAQLIDMRQHTGAHPRIGATDVCPFIPLQYLSHAQLNTYVQQVAKRVGEELEIPVFLYEQSASAPHRSNLAVIRKGEYEGLPEKLHNPQWQPDFGPSRFSPKSGATVMGARDFLIAYNISLETEDVEVAKEIAARIRERGRKIRHPATGEWVQMPGLIPHLKAIGWFMPEYNCAQVSTNIVNIEQAPLWLVYDSVCDMAQEMGTRVRGSELIGLVPKRALMDTGYQLLRREKSPVQVGDDVVMRRAIDYLRFGAHGTFHPMERILEFALGRAMRNARTQEDVPPVS